MSLKSFLYLLFDKLKDTEFERNFLIREIFPKLRTYCEAKGLEFQVRFIFIIYLRNSKNRAMIRGRDSSFLRRDSRLRVYEITRTRTQCSIQVFCMGKIHGKIININF